MSNGVNSVKVTGQSSKISSYIMARPFMEGFFSAGKKMP
jgi:hypothetical protein